MFPPAFNIPINSTLSYLLSIIKSENMQTIIAIYILFLYLICISRNNRKYDDDDTTNREFQIGVFNMNSC